MKTTELLTTMIPTLNAVRGAGAFNVVVARLTGDLVERIRVAANDDRIVAADLLQALDGLDKAKTFEEQQSAMATAVTVADALLGAIASGTVQVADRVAPAARDLIARIAVDVAGLEDVFRPDPVVLHRIRTDASELSVLVDAEIREGLRPADHAYNAAQLFDNADRLTGASYAELERAGAAIVMNVRALAA